MLRNIIAVVLLAIGGLIGLVLLTYGGPIWPHLAGPIVMIGVGLVVLLYKRGKKQQKA